MWRFLHNRRLILRLYYFQGTHILGTSHGGPCVSVASCCTIPIVNMFELLAIKSAEICSYALDNWVCFVLWTVQKWAELRRSFHRRPSRSRFCIFSRRESFNSWKCSSQFWQHATALCAAWLSSFAGSTFCRSDQVSLTYELFWTTCSDNGQLLCAKGKAHLQFYQW